MDLGSIHWNDVPWYVSVPFMIAVVILSFVATRLKAKDTAQSQLIEETMKRQTSLDTRQEKMFDDLQEEVDRLREDMTALRKELNAERLRNVSMEEEMKVLRAANETLRQENLRLTELVSELRRELEAVKRQQHQ